MLAGLMVATTTSLSFACLARTIHTCAGQRLVRLDDGAVRGPNPFPKFHGYDSERDLFPEHTL